MKIAADKENLEDAHAKFLVRTSLLTELNRDKSLIYFCLEWKNTSLIFWPSHLEIVAELVYGVCGRTVLCHFQNGKECFMALNNDKIGKV